MLKITVPATELFDGVGNFINTKEQTLQLEHSLVSLSKWEAKWHKPYLSRKAMTIVFLILKRCWKRRRHILPTCSSTTWNWK